MYAVERVLTAWVKTKWKRHEQHISLSADAVDNTLQERNAFSHLPLRNAYAPAIFAVNNSFQTSGLTKIEGESKAFCVL